MIRPRQPCSITSTSDSFFSRPRAEVKSEFAPATWQAFWQTAVENLAPDGGRGRARAVGRVGVRGTQPRAGPDQASELNDLGNESAERHE